MRNFYYLLFLLLIGSSCKNDEMNQTTQKVNLPDPLAGLSISSKVFGETPEGTAYLYTLTNKNGMEVGITNFGGIIVSLKTPNKAGNSTDVVLGFDDLEGYRSSANPYFGGIIGRYGNRIGKGKFSIDGNTYQLAKNNGPNHLHGGEKGFDKVIWKAKETSGGDSKGLELTYRSKDMEEGYPGNMNVKVYYLLNNQNEFMIRYEANTDKPTLCNLTNHTYFNLAGEGNGDILNHQIRINADWFTPVDKTLIPTGTLMPVKDTPFDFRVAKTIGQDILKAETQLKYGNGYDHNFVVANPGGKRALIATVYEPTSGRFMEVFSEEPGVQFYTGNFLNGTISGKGGKKYDLRTGFCLETQHYPDSPNQDKFPSTILRPLESYKTSTLFKFSVR